MSTSETMVQPAALVETPRNATLPAAGTRELGAPATVAVAMSGGVDSSTVAAILHERGEAIIGLTMQL